MTGKTIVMPRFDPFAEQRAAQVEKIREWKAKQCAIYNRAKAMRDNPSRESSWLLSRWTIEGMDDASDKVMQPYEYHVPRIRNVFYLYLVDLLPAVEVEDDFYRSKGYRIFRVEAFDEGGLKTAIETMRHIQALRKRPGR